MKILYALMLVAASAANADTIALGPDECGITKQCVNIPNDAAVDVSIYAAPYQTAVALYITTYDASGAPTTVAYRSPTGNGTVYNNLQMQDSAGHIVLLSATFSTFKTCVRSGRGQSCSLHWQLLGGTVTN